MPAVRFHCVTENRALHEEIKNKLFLAGGALVREKVTKDAHGEWRAEMEMVSEGGTLYRQVKELNLAISCTIIQ
jgi:hypothetical protein